MGWLWRADADGGTDGEETPRRAESADGMPSDMGQWEESNAAAAEGIATGNSEFEANRFDMVRPITQERLGLLFDSEAGRGASMMIVTCVDSGRGTCSASVSSVIRAKCCRSSRS